MAPNYHQPSLTSVPVTVHSTGPTLNGQIFRYALIFETLANVVFVILGIIYAPILPSLINLPASQSVGSRLKAAAGAAPPSGVSELTVHTLIGFIICLTVPLVLSIPNTRAGIESRPATYAMMLAGEFTLCGQLAFEALTGRNGLDPKRCWFLVQQIVPAVLWRIWVLAFRPAWMGLYREVPVKKA